MKKYILLFWISASLLFLNGCTDSFFELLPNDKVPVTYLYKSEKDFNTALMGCYAYLQSDDSYSYYSELCEYRSDNLRLLAPTTGTQDRWDIDTFVDNQSNGVVLGCWENFYNGIHRCNLILGRIDEASFDETLKKQYKGEALFIRALTYFNMYRVWGGVPIAKGVTPIEDAMLIARSSDEDMHDFIVEDLKAIIDENMLPDSYNAANVGRVSSGATKALLGKVYLTFHKWVEARDVFTELTTGSYELLPNIGDVFNVDNKNNKEVIFTINWNKSIIGEGHDNWFSITNASDYLNSQSNSLLNCFLAGDNRKDMITYVQVVGEQRFSLNKYYDTRDPLTEEVGNNQIILRYADVLLMYAEALNEIGYSNSQDSPALIALNKVHQRAGLAPIQISTLTSKEEFRKAIMFERQCEFPYEGHRWFDLIRMGGAIDVILANSSHVIEDWQLLFPIPQEALERINNTSILWQNPGY